MDIAIVGDSHAGQWIPALSALAARAGLKIHVFTKSSCPFTTAEILDKGRVYEECSQWNRNLLDVLRATRPEMVFSSASSSYRARDDQGRRDAAAIAAGQQLLWRELDAMDVQVVVVRDTPRPARAKMDPAECLAQADARPADCSLARAGIVVPESEDPNLLGARGLPFVRTVDLTDHICSAAACDAVVGNVVVWRDNNHITATYARSLAGALHQALAPALSNTDVRQATTVTGDKTNTVEVMRGTLSCGPSGRHPSFERTVDLIVSDRRVEMRRGDWQQRDRGYEVWRGSMAEDGRVTMSGHYREGSPDIKQVEFSGHRTDGRIELEGRRGPRECRFVAVRVRHPTSQSSGAVLQSHDPKPVTAVPGALTR